MIATITGAVQAAARTLGRRIHIPGWPPGLEQCGVNHACVPWFECQIDRASVFIVKKGALPRRPSIFGSKNAALGVRSVSVSQYSDKYFIGIPGIDEDARNLARVAQSNRCPGFAGVR